MNRPPKFRIKLFGVDVSAEGVLGIGGACFLVIAIIVATRL
ncbi:hypothetical protein [Tardiphaga robiniae]|nr:hypothetical protein [Tardiphaga robiniae]